MTAVSDIDREARWELRGIQEGIARYRRSAAERDPSSLPEAQLVLRECVGRLAEAIRKDQEAALGFVRNEAGGQPPKWAAPILLFDAEALAVLTVMGAFASAERPGTTPESRTTLTQRAAHLARTMQDQLAYDTWSGRTGVVVEGHPLRKISRSAPDLTQREWKVVKKRLAIGRSKPWSDVVGIVVGAMLLERLCQTCPEWFTMGLKAHAASGSATYTLMLTDRALELMLDVRSRAEVTYPQLLPMIVPPNPWVYKQ